jgi:hypothetical protein
VTIEEPDQKAGEKVPETGLGQEGTGLAMAEDARTDDEISAIPDRGEEKWHLFGMVGVVAVQENDDLGGLPLESRDPGEAGAAIALAFLADEPDRELPRHEVRAVVRAIVHDDDLARLLSRDVTHD